MTSSTVIKADAMRPNATRVHTFNLKDYRAEADAIIKRANGEAAALSDRIRKAAEARAAELLEKCRREGLAQGRAEGFEQGRAEALAQATDEFQQNQESLVAAMQCVIDAFDARRREWASAIHRDAVELALEIARRVVKRIGAVDRDVAVANLRELIERVGHGRDLTIFVHPDDAAAIRQFAQTITTAEHAWTHVKISEDTAVEPGGCRVEADGGTLDATLMTQLDRIADELVPWRNAAS